MQASPSSLDKTNHPAVGFGEFYDEADDDRETAYRDQVEGRSDGPNGWGSYSDGDDGRYTDGEPARQEEHEHTRDPGTADDKITELQASNAELKAENEQFGTDVAELKGENTELRRGMSALEARVDHDHDHLPPGPPSVRSC